MLSVVVVGRNDNHGYNLGKRVASSLNSISMRMRQGDELIFVDWNTPRPFPPMPVSIIDDLTNQTKKFLRTIVVDPKIHNQFKSNSSKMILESIARNAGIRRANPGNTWILSTNTDILFVGEEDLSFQDLIVRLDKRLWQSFRYEVPEYIWEVLDKRNPQAINHILQRISETTPIKLNLTTSPTENKINKFVFVDAIGDFQLAPREIWDLIKGFPEEMLHGWHVDSRAAVQMVRKSGQESKILPAEYGLSIFHQNHLRSLTHFHSNEPMNSLELIQEFYENQTSWGISDIQLQEWQIQDFSEKFSSISLPISSKITENHLQSVFTHNFYNIDRAFFFLMDELNALKAKDHITILSVNENLIHKIKSQVKPLDVTIEVIERLELSKSTVSSLAQSDLVILDFGVDETDEKSQQKIFYAGLIAIGLPSIARAIRPNTRVALIRAQNWAIRSLSKYYFAVPLFNNYSAVLTGVRKLQSRKIKYGQRVILFSAIRFDYGLKTKFERFFNVKHPYLKKFLPRKLRSLIRKLIFR